MSQIFSLLVLITTLWKKVLLFSLYRWGNWSTQSYNLLKVPQLVSGRAGIWTDIVTVCIASVTVLLPHKNLYSGQTDDGGGIACWRAHLISRCALSVLLHHCRLCNGYFSLVGDLTELVNSLGFYLLSWEEYVYQSSLPFLFCSSLQKCCSLSPSAQLQQIPIGSGGRDTSIQREHLMRI